MPQMNPIWWLTLFILFTLIFLLTNSLNYFMKNNTLGVLPQTNKSLTFINWKW